MTAVPISTARPIPYIMLPIMSFIMASSFITQPLRSEHPSQA
jgi:hypothetical protein